MIVKKLIMNAICNFIPPLLLLGCLTHLHAQEKCNGNNIATSSNYRVREVKVATYSEFFLLS